MANQVLHHVERPICVDGKVVNYILFNPKTRSLVLNWTYERKPIPGSNSVPLAEFRRALEVLRRLPRDPDAFEELRYDPEEGDPSSYRRALISHEGVRFAFHDGPGLSWLGLSGEAMEALASQILGQMTRLEQRVLTSSLPPPDGPQGEGNTSDISH